MLKTDLEILGRVGTVLLAVGVIDIGVMIYCIANEISYASSFNIFAVVAGVCLRRGSLRVASWIQWFSTLMLSAMAALAVGLPLSQPLSLTATQLRLYPGTAAAAVAMILAMGTLLFCMARELGREPVRLAAVEAGIKPRNMRMAAFGGVAIVVVTLVGLALMSSGESAAHAKSLAAQQVGSGFRFHVSSMQIHFGSEGTVASAEVTAWTDAEVRSIHVQWTAP